MAKTKIELIVPVKVSVDLDDWSVAYGQTLPEAETDARRYVPQILAAAIDRALRDIANGAGLISPVPDYPL